LALGLRVCSSYGKYIFKRWSDSFQVNRICLPQFLN
jgi:hypothetical protein